jgi:hypothetical protein
MIMPQWNLCTGGQYSQFMAKSQNIVSPNLKVEIVGMLKILSYYL